MLSEAYGLCRSLEQNSCELPESHPDVKEPGKNPGYRVALGEDGLPQEIEEVEREEMACFWTIREGKHNSFPVVNIQRPLLDVPVDAPLRQQLADLKRQQGRKRVALLEQGLRDHPIHLGGNELGMWVRLRAKAEGLQRHFSGKDNRFDALPALIRRFTDRPPEPKDFLDALARRLLYRLAGARLQDTLLAEKLLLGQYAKGASVAKAEVRIVLDAAGEFEVRVASGRMKAHVCRCLANRAQNPGRGRCGLSGDNQPLLTERSPEPKLPLLGETKFFSMNADTPCQRRYGLTGLAAFPLGALTAGRMERAIKFITAAGRKGKTWRTVASGKFEVKAGRKTERADLLVVYVDGEPVIDAQVADCFGVGPLEVEKQFTVDAAAVCKAFEGIVARRRDSRLNLFLLRKADKEKKQVILAESPTVKEVLDAVHWWQEAATDVPEVSVLLPPQKEGEKATREHPSVPFPDQVVRLLSEAWVKGGLEQRKVEAPGLGQVLEVMLRIRGGWERTVQLLLGLMLARLGPLLSGLFGAMLTEDPGRWQRYPERSRRSALLATSVLGILLHALGRRKETYMNETAFLVGRLLALADTLHKEYCRHVRKGDTPPQLLGNALMPVAAANPADAVARLGQRLLIYRAWADKVQGEPYGLAKWAVREMGEVCQRLPRPLPPRVDQTFQAELFLGYMARPPAKAGAGEGDNHDSATQR